MNSFTTRANLWTSNKCIKIAKTQDVESDDRNKDYQLCVCKMLPMALRRLNNFHLLLLLLLSALEDVVRSENCGVTPTSSRYKVASLYQPAPSPPSCISTQTAGEEFYLCTQSSITNGEHGPENYSDAATTDYFRWSAPGGQIEFNFSKNIYFTKVKVTFYVNEDPDLALPKLRILGENEQGLPECTTASNTGNIVKSVDLLSLHSNPRPSLGRHMIETNLAGTSSALLLCILPAKNYNFALTEIVFCTNDTLTVSTPPTTASDEITTTATTTVKNSTATVTEKVEPGRTNTVPVGLPVGIILGLVLLMLVILVVAIVVWKITSSYQQKSKDQSEAKNMMSHSMSA